MLSPEDLNQLLPAATHAFPSPVPTQNVSSDEYMPRPQSASQARVQSRLTELANELAKREGISRRSFFQSASGMAASYLVMNEVYGALFAATPAEAATPEMANARADALKGQFIMDFHTHHLRMPAGIQTSRTGRAVTQICSMTTISRRSFSTAIPRWR
jgi:uncharacterized protein